MPSLRLPSLTAAPRRSSFSVGTATLRSWCAVRRTCSSHCSKDFSTARRSAGQLFVFWWWDSVLPLSLFSTLCLVVFALSCYYVRPLFPSWSVCPGLAVSCSTLVILYLTVEDSSELKRLRAVEGALADFTKSSMPGDTGTTRQEFNTHVQGSSDDDSFAISIVIASFIARL